MSFVRPSRIRLNLSTSLWLPGHKLRNNGRRDLGSAPVIYSNSLGNIHAGFAKLECRVSQTWQEEEHYHRQPMSPGGSHVVFVRDQSREACVEDVEKWDNGQGNEDFPRGENVSSLDLNGGRSECLCADQYGNSQMDPPFAFWCEIVFARMKTGAWRMTPGRLSIPHQRRRPVR